MKWRLAKSLQQLVDEVNERWPTRNKSWDGSIGDAAHRKRKSDHNPNPQGVVCAVDITHDPSPNGPNSEALAELLRVRGDRRLQYVISNKKIANMDIQSGEWRAYDKHPHDHHVHVSVRQDPALWDREEVWLSDIPMPPPTVPVRPRKLIQVGSRGEDVREIQRIVHVDGIYGPATKLAVQRFQRLHGLDDDGIVGPVTWAKLQEKRNG